MNSIDQMKKNKTSGYYNIKIPTLLIIGPVIANFSAIRGRVPTVEEIMIKTGRSRKGVIEVLTSLDRQKFIEWSPIKPMILIQAWEINEPIRSGKAHHFHPDYF
jgi:DNA-binding FadR family transcriptional regulator